MPKNCSPGDASQNWIFILKLNVCGIITVAAVLGSYFVLRAFHKFRNLRTASNNILVSLSIADGLIAIPLILDIILYNVGNRSLFCNLKEVSGTVTLFLLSVIVLHFSLMSSERHRHQVRLKIPHHSDQTPSTDRFHRGVAVGSGHCYCSSMDALWDNRPQRLQRISHRDASR